MDDGKHGCVKRHVSQGSSYCYLDFFFIIRERRGFLIKLLEFPLLKQPARGIIKHMYSVQPSLLWKLWRDHCCKQAKKTVDIEIPLRYSKGTHSYKATDDIILLC